MARMRHLPSIICVIIYVTSWITFASGGVALNDYIRDYQPLDYSPEHVHQEHRRVRRQVDTSPLTLTLAAYNRTFHLKLKPSTSIFSHDHMLLFGSEAPHKVDTSFIYDGRVEGIPSSSVHLSIMEGSISGHIVIPGDTTYHIESARNHFSDSEFHTIIYPETSMVLDPYKHLRRGSCGSQELYEKLRQMSQPAEELPKWKPSRNTFSRSHNKYSAEANRAAGLNRTRRALAIDKTTCFMSLQADKLLYDHIFNKQTASDSQTKDQKTREAILAMFATHITALNNIYTVTNFVETDNPSVSFQGVNFQLQRSSIITECTTASGWAAGYCVDNLDVSNFLDLTSQTNHDKFCLVHTFTYRDFAGGTLGLAWVAAPNSPSSGICGRYGRVQDSSGISTKSLNTGIVTLINFNVEVPSRVSQLTFAHEVGHNFGAQHDSTDVCAPYGTSQPGASDGNYIMFPSSNQGNLPNNAKFSSCSKDYIAKVLNTLAPSGQRVNCFNASGVSFCGNKVVEEGEECDCGYADDCSDQCCHAADDPMPCMRTNLSVCSPSEGGCCKQDCTFISNTEKCQEASECKNEQFCNGNNGSCPAAQPKEDKVFCESYTHVCLSGDCIGSVCLKINWTECFKTSAEGASNEEMCYISCRKDSASECISSFDTGKVEENQEFKDLLQEIASNTISDPDNPLGVKRPAGSACDDYQGYCDVFSKCRKVDAEGPFKQLTDLIFDPVTLKNIKTWIEDHWWAVLLIAVGVIVFMGVFVKVFSYHTPSRDPNKKNLPQARPGGRPPAGRQPQPDKRSGVYSVDVPMQDRGRAAPPQGHVNYAYQGHQGYLGSGHSSNRGHQQFDRISEPRRY